MTHSVPLKQAGFTLIEAMVVITIMTIIAGFGSASFVWLNQATEMRGTAFDLVADLDFARSEAVKRNADVTVAPVGDSWANGWTVVAGVDTLRTRAAVKAGLGFAAAPAALIFDGSGRTTLDAAGNFRICPPPSASVMGRNVRIDPSGLSRSSKTSCV